MAVYCYFVVFLLLIRKCELTSVASNISISSAPFPPAHVLPVHETSDGSANNNNSNWPLIILVCALSIIVVAIVIQLFCCCCNRNGKKKYPGNDEEQNVLLDTPDHIETVEKKQQPRSVSNKPKEDFDTRVLISVKQQLPTDKSSDPVESKDYKGVPKGLVNIGNTCYFNAVLQCLNHTYLFGTKLYAPEQSGKLTVPFKEFLNLMQYENMPCIVPNYLHSVFCELVPRFADGKQHDSHECLRHFLDELRKEERASWLTLTPDQVRRTMTLVDKLFGGHFMTVYTCGTCEGPYHICEPFLDISLPCLTDAHRNDLTKCSGLYDTKAGDKTHSVEVPSPESLYRKAAKLVVTPLNRQSANKLQDSQLCPSVEDCLRRFTRNEFMANEYLCHSCSNAGQQGHIEGIAQLTSTTKRTVILNPPAILVLHLKRFEQRPSSFIKCNTKIFYEELLDISPFCSLWCMRNEKQEENIWYALYAVVVHVGSSLKSGHYVTYVKIRDDNQNLERFIQVNYFDCDVSAEQLTKMLEQQKVMEGQRNTSWKAKGQHGTWYRMSDSAVYRVNTQEVLNQNAYLLFYERLDSADV